MSDDWGLEAEIIGPVAAQSVTVILQAKAMHELKPLMRQVVHTIGQEEGPDRFQLKVEGVDLVFDFPNSSTRWTPQLQRQVTTIPGVRRVQVH